MAGSTSIDPKVLQAAAAQVVDRCDKLAEYSDDANGLTRVFCSPAMQAAHSALSQWMRGHKLAPVLDAVGNLIGRPEVDVLNSETAQRKPVLMIGSHLDTVVNAGRFDGMLGILLGLGVVQVINACDVELPFDIHVVAFSEEEGVRFGYPFIGSKGIAGDFDAACLERSDAGGKTMREALVEFGCGLETGSYRTASYAGDDLNQPYQLVGFLEAHIEQAVVLQDADVPCGVVTSIAGQTRAMFELRGMAGHAGTVPHDRRRDALAAAAELVLAVEKIGVETEGLFATVGKLEAFPGLSNVICGHSRLRLDLRHESDSVRQLAYKEIRAAMVGIAQRRNVEIEIAGEQHTPAVPMDGELSRCLGEAIVDAGYKSKTMVSGAGHDAMIMAKVARSCMLFVRCKDGTSHHPDEFVSPADIHVALSVMVSAVLKMAEMV